MSTDTKVLEYPVVRRRLSRNERWIFHLALAAVLAIAVAGCGKKESDEHRRAARRYPAACREAVDASTRGAVTGKVTLDGKPTKEDPIDMSAEACCQKAEFLRR